MAHTIKFLKNLLKFASFSLQGMQKSLWVSFVGISKNIFDILITQGEWKPFFQNTQNIWNDCQIFREAPKVLKYPLKRLGGRSRPREWHGLVYWNFPSRNEEGNFKRMGLYRSTYIFRATRATCFAGKQANEHQAVQVEVATFRNFERWDTQHISFFVSKKPSFWDFIFGLPINIFGCQNSICTEPPNIFQWVCP